MSAYKKLNKQDAYITTYNAHKPWAFLGGKTFITFGIETFNSAVGYDKGIYDHGIIYLPTSYYAQSLAQLYYPTRSSATGEIISHSFDYYDQTTLYISGARTYDKNRINTGLDRKPFIISIPRKLSGVAIKPGSFRFKVDNPGSSIGILDGYVQSGYVTNGGISSQFLNSSDIVFLDDGEGTLYISSSSPRYTVGDIIYPHGIVTVTDDRYIEFFDNISYPAHPAGGGWLMPNSWETSLINFESTQPIFTHNYHCKIRESEYNFTYNPSALSGSLKTVYDNENNIYSPSSSVSDGVLRNNITGSAFQPYITTVGLYNDANQLIAVGKMSQPVPKPANTEMTIIVKIDI